MVSTKTYRISGNTASPARIIIEQSGGTNFCRVLRADVRATSSLANPSNTFVRAHVTCADSLTPEIPAAPGARYLGDPPVPAIYPAQPMLVYDVAAQFNASQRAEFNFMLMPQNVPPMGPTWYSCFPYIITLFCNAPICATVVVQFT